MSCNQKRIMPGTVCFICVADGSHGYIGGAIVLHGNCDTQQETDDQGNTVDVDFVDGTLWGFPVEYQLDGARIKFDPRWNGRAPFGKKAQFRSGESLRPNEVDVLRDLLHPMVWDWCHILSREITNNV
jgi:hypothetical protein